MKKILVLLAFAVLALQADAKPKKKKVDVDVRQPPKVQTFEDTEQEMKQRNCDPELPNLAVSDFNLTDKNYNSFKKQNPLFVIGLSDSDCALCCTTERLLKNLQDEFKAKKYVYKVRITRVNVSRKTKSSR
jgi:hypothetical protein